MDYEIEFPKRYIKPKLPMGKQWVEALRGGKYKQGRGLLHSSLNDCYCCLGVLSNIQGRLNSGRDNCLYGSGTYLHKTNPLFDVLDCDGNFPKGVSVISEGYSRNDLTELNDEGFGFNQIADIIEKIWDCQ